MTPRAPTSGGILNDGSTTGMFSAGPIAPAWGESRSARGWDAMQRTPRHGVLTGGLPEVQVRRRKSRCHLMLQLIILPGQARDKHREKLREKSDLCVFFTGIATWQRRDTTWYVDELGWRTASDAAGSQADDARGGSATRFAAIKCLLGIHERERARRPRAALSEATGGGRRRRPQAGRLAGWRLLYP
jgi:hypothetical protein